MAPKKKTDDVAPNGHNKHNGHVSLAREEYDAFVSREESFVELVTENAKNVNRLRELVQTCDTQAKYLAEAGMKISSLERVNGLQSAFIEMLRGDATNVSSLQELSEFWRQWVIHTTKAIDDRNVSREEAVKFEPDLFRTWRNWTNDSNKTDRVIGVAGSRTTRDEHDAIIPNNPKEWQEHTIRRLREEIAKLSASERQLKAEIEAYKSDVTKRAQLDNKQQERRS